MEQVAIQMRHTALTIDETITRHLASGLLQRVNDSTFAASSARHDADVLVRVIPGRAIVTLDDGASLPLEPVIQEQLNRFGGCEFYASAEQLDTLLAAMS